MVWLIVLIAIFLIAYLGESRSGFTNSYQKSSRILLIIVFAFIAGFGSVVCEDHPLYASFYSSLNFSDISKWEFHLLRSENNRYEIGYLILNYVGKLLFLGEAGFFFFVAIIVNTCIVRFAYGFKNAALTLTYLFLSGMLLQEGNLVRQYIAAAFFLMSIKHIVQPNIKMYLLWVLLAMTFHMSSVILLVFIPLLYINSSKKESIAVIVLAGMYIISILVATGSIAIPLLNSLSLLTSYEVYLTDTNDVGMSFSMARILLLNAGAIYVLLSQHKSRFVYASIMVFAVSVFNISIAFPNLVRFYVLFDVVLFAFLFDCLDFKQGHSKIHNMSLRIAKAAMVFFCVFILFKDYVFNDKVLFCSELYSLSQFFQ